MKGCLVESLHWTAIWRFVMESLLWIVIFVEKSTLVKIIWWIILQDIQDLSLNANIATKFSGKIKGFYTAQQKHESTLLHTYVLNAFLTADRSCTTKYFWKILYKMVAHIFTLLLAPFASKSVNYSRYSESLNSRKISEIGDICLR